MPKAKPKPERVTLKQDGRDMPVDVYNDSLMLWPGFTGWTRLSKDEAVALAEMILSKFGR